MKDMNHDFIEALIGIYERLPESSKELAIRRVAVLIERNMNELERQGQEVTRESLLAQVQKSMSEFGRVA